MPPSGFSQKAINGLLQFVGASYQRILEEYEGSDLSESKILEESASRLEKLTQGSAQIILPSVSREGLNGLVAFVSENYKDLVKDITGGKKQEGYAIRTELEHINKYLSKFRI